MRFFKLLVTRRCVAKSRFLRRTLAGLLVAAGLVQSHSGAQAEIIAEEPFTYGSTAGVLAGKNGGTGFSTAWADQQLSGSNPLVPWDYTPNGLTFGSVATSGGAARWTNGSDNTRAGQANRQLTTSLTSNVYGTFLFRIDERPTTSNSTAALLIGEQTDSDGSASFTMNAPQFGTGSIEGAVRINGSADNFLSNGGSPLTVGNGTVGSGTTYMALFEYDPTVASSQGWILSLDQFVNFAGSSTLTPTDLDNAALGSGSTQVMQRGGLSGTTGSNDYLALFGAFENLNVTYDEIRLSNTSLSEAAAVPEPSTLALAGMGLLAAAGVYRRRLGGRGQA